MPFLADSKTENATRRGPSGEEIRKMFDDLAGHYNLFNLFTAAGLMGWWRRAALAGLRPGMRVLDLGCGTGDLTLLAARKLKGQGQVVGIDFSGQMLTVAERRAARFPEKERPSFILKKAEELPLPGSAFDWVVSGFVLRNIYENIDSILEGVRASLKPGGQIRFLDMTEPEKSWVRSAWRFYMNTLVWLYGRFFFGTRYPATYLVDSAHRFLRAGEVSEKIRQKGFSDVRTRYFFFGIIVLFEARKP